MPSSLRQEHEIPFHNSMVSSCGENTAAEEQEEETVDLNVLYMVYDMDEDDDFAAYMKNIDSLLTKQDDMERDRLGVVDDAEEAMEDLKRQRALLEKQSAEITQFLSRRHKPHRHGDGDGDDSGVEGMVDSCRHSNASESDASNYEFDLPTCYQENLSTMSQVSDSEVLSAEIDESMHGLDLTEYDSDSTNTDVTDMDNNDLPETATATLASTEVEVESDKDDSEDSYSHPHHYHNHHRYYHQRTVSWSESDTSISSTRSDLSSLSNPEQFSSSSSPSSGSTSPKTPSKKRKNQRSWTILKRHVLGLDLSSPRSKSADLALSLSPTTKGSLAIRKFSQRLLKRDPTEDNRPVAANHISQESVSNVPADIRSWHYNRPAAPNREDKLKKLLGDAPTAVVNNQGNMPDKSLTSPVRGNKLKALLGDEITEQTLAKQHVIETLPHSYYWDTREEESMANIYTEENLSKYAGFRAPHSDSNIHFETTTISSGNSSEKLIIRSATLDKLIEWLTNHERFDSEFVSIFLLMYKSFTTPEVLFEKLVMRYNTPPPLNPLLLQPWDTLSRKQRELVYEEFQHFLKSFLTPVRIRVVNVVSTWVDRFYYDFRDDPSLRRRLLTFIDILVHTHMHKPASKISAAMMRRSKRRDTFTQQQIQELLKYSELTKFTSRITNGKQSASTLNIRSRDIANQLTIISYGMFEKIQPKEFFGQAWARKNRRQRAPNVVAMIQRSNTVGSWVAHEILSQSDIRDRVVMVKKMIKTCAKLRKLRNYNTLVEILSGLNSNPIHRLKLTWATFERLQPDHMATFRELVALTSSKKNFAALRSALKSEPPPAIPYMGMYLTDITFIEDGNNDMTSMGHINWTKRRWLAEIIREIQLFQRTRYFNIADLPQLRAKLMSINSPDLDALYDLSLVVEPRKQSTPSF